MMKGTARALFGVAMHHTLLMYGHVRATRNIPQKL